MTYEQAIRNLNEAAYLAVRAAAREGLASEATRLRSIALDSDELVNEFSAFVRDTQRDKQMVVL